jgi:hypothetical protein
MNAGDVVLLVLIVLVATLIPIAVGLFWVKRTQARRLQEVIDRFPSARLVEPALFYGQESSGRRHLRGNGVLALLPDQLHFAMLVPRRELTIPLHQITAVDSPTSFLGKTNFKPLLRISVQPEGGQADAMAWLVTDLAAWKAHLAQYTNAPAAPR